MKPKLKYTTERPVVPGYYWFKNIGYEEIVRVSGEGAWMKFDSFGSSHAYQVHDAIMIEGSIQWAGPIEIEKPEE